MVQGKMNEKKATKPKRKNLLRKKQFFVISLLIIILFLVFQLVGNFSFIQSMDPSVEMDEEKIDEHLERLTQQMKTVSDYQTEESPEYLVFSEGFEENIKETMSVLETLAGLKHTHMCVNASDSSDLELSEYMDSLQGVIICGDKEGNVLSRSQLQKFIDKGIPIIYTQMPEAEAIRENGLDDVFGIYQLNGMARQKGMRFLGKVFVGGNMDLKNIEYSMEDVELLPTCKVYAYALNESEEETDTKNEELPPIIWRNTMQNSKIFVVNGTFFEENQGYGILTSILSQIYGDYLYPIANALVMIHDSLPYDGVTDEELMKKMYGRNSLRFQTDIFVPDIISLCKREDIIPTFYSSASSEMKEMDFFKRSIIDLEGELADEKSARVKAIDTFGQKGRIWEEYPNIPVTASGYKKKDANLLKLYSIGSAFGFVVHKVDASEIVNPESEAFNWVSVVKDYGKYIAYYQEDFGKLESRTAKNASICYMEYRLMEPHISYGENRIDVKINHMPGKASFVLRTEKKIEDVAGCQYTKLGDDVYLIKTENDSMSIILKEENAVYQESFDIINKE